MRCPNLPSPGGGGFPTRIRNGVSTLRSFLPTCLGGGTSAGMKGVLHEEARLASRDVARFGAPVDGLGPPRRRTDRGRHTGGARSRDRETRGLLHGAELQGLGEGAPRLRALLPGLRERRQPVRV